MALYAMAVTGRFGLGHGLLAWGRSVVWARKNNATLIAPNWLQLRVGPYLRRERDKRFYYRLFRSGQQVGGIRRIALLLQAKRMRVEECETLTQPSHGTSDIIVEFHNAVADNEAKHFHEIFGHAQLVHAALLDMTKPRYHPHSGEKPHIAVHIRGGDFAIAASPDQLLKGGHNLRLPVEWYTEMIQALRNTVRIEVPVIVYSDCADMEIAPVLQLPNSKRSETRQSITDMLAMAQATVMISSGSGFSRWGSYLGQVPRICYPGQRGVRVIGPVRDSTENEPESLNGRDLPMQFKNLVVERFSRANGNANWDSN
jgi:hypothetical protein